MSSVLSTISVLVSRGILSRRIGKPSPGTSDMTQSQLWFLVEKVTCCHHLKTSAFLFLSLSFFWDAYTYCCFGSATRWRLRLLFFFFFASLPCNKFCNLSVSLVTSFTKSETVTKSLFFLKAPNLKITLLLPPLRVRKAAHPTFETSKW